MRWRRGDWCRWGVFTLSWLIIAAIFQFAWIKDWQTTAAIFGSLWLIDVMITLERVEELRKEHEMLETRLVQNYGYGSKSPYQRGRNDERKNRRWHRR